MKPWLSQGNEERTAVIAIVVQEQFQDKVPEQTLCRAAESALQISNVIDSPSLSIRITDDTEMQDLNLRFRGIDKTTDVLSFGEDFTDPDLKSRYLGDIVISYPQAENQANTRNHAATDELQLLVIHGVLHLLGYDHGTEDEKNDMWSLQGKILDQLGLSIQVEDM
jgi:probable rRNA maturation factor